jgi:ABC-type proline/glycine betaine transport system permease subunit
MTNYLLLLAESTLSVTVSFIVMYVLSQPLKNVLHRICPDELAALFWVKYTKVMLVIAPLLLVLIVDMLARYQDPIECLRMALIAALTGVLIGLHLLGKRLSRFEVLPHTTGQQK